MSATCSMIAVKSRQSPTDFYHGYDLDNPGEMFEGGYMHTPITKALAVYVGYLVPPSVCKCITVGVKAIEQLRDFKMVAVNTNVTTYIGTDLNGVFHSFVSKPEWEQYDGAFFVAAGDRPGCSILNAIDKGLSAPTGRGEEVVTVTVELTLRGAQCDEIHMSMDIPLG